MTQSTQRWWGIPLEIMTSADPSCRERYTLISRCYLASGIMSAFGRSNILRYTRMSGPPLWAALNTVILLGTPCVGVGGVFLKFSMKSLGGVAILIQVYLWKGRWGAEISSKATRAHSSIDVLYGVYGLGGMFSSFLAVDGSYNAYGIFLTPCVVTRACRIAMEACISSAYKYFKLYVCSVSLIGTTLDECLPRIRPVPPFFGLGWF